MNNSINNMFINSIFGATSAKEIIVYFSYDPEPVVYTVDVLELLKTEPAVQTICDGETGEIIYCK